MALQGGGRPDPAFATPISGTPPGHEQTRSSTSTHLQPRTGISRSFYLHHQPRRRRLSFAFCVQIELRIAARAAAKPLLAVPGICVTSRALRSPRACVSLTRQPTARLRAPF
jgi:hypothetical protein